MNNNGMRAIKMSEFTTGAMSATSAARLMSRKTLERFVVAFGLFIGGFNAAELSGHVRGLTEALSSGNEPTHINKLEANRPRPNLTFVKFGKGAPTLDNN